MGTCGSSTKADLEDIKHSVNTLKTQTDKEIHGVEARIQEIESWLSRHKPICPVASGRLVEAVAAPPPHAGK
jgi:hypothetical protein